MYIEQGALRRHLIWWTENSPGLPTSLRHQASPGRCPWNLVGNGVKRSHRPEPRIQELELLGQAFLGYRILSARCVLQVTAPVFSFTLLSNLHLSFEMARVLSGSCV